MDPGDLSELAPDAARRLRVAIDAANAASRGDVQALIDCVPEHGIVTDHRSFSKLRGGLGAWADNMDFIWGVAPDARLEITDVKAAGTAGALLALTLHGTADDVVFERAMLIALEYDADGRWRQADFFDDFQVDAARERYAEIAAGPDPDPAENHAALSVRTFIRDWNAQDTKRVAFRAPDAVQQLWPAPPHPDPGANFLVATRENRFAVTQFGDGLAAFEVSPDAKLVWQEVFSADEIDAAIAAMHARCDAARNS